MLFAIKSESHPKIQQSLLLGSLCFSATDLAPSVKKEQISQISANALSFPRPRVAMLGLKPSQGKPGAWKTLSMSRKFSNLALLDLGNKIW